MNPHLALQERIGAEYGHRLAGPVELRQDALVASLDNGVSLELRCAAADAYSIQWRWGDAALRIDTAPAHRGLATFPNHLHDAEGGVRADPLTQPGADIWANLRAVLDAVLDDPLLASLGSTPR